jgi:SOS-response transcriptional repressor LexA
MAETVIARPSLIRVLNDSLASNGINQGDFLVVEQRTHARGGDILAVVVDGEVVAKELNREDRGLEIVGVAVGVVPKEKRA